MQMGGGSEMQPRIVRMGGSEVRPRILTGIEDLMSCITTLCLQLLVFRSKEWGGGGRSVITPQSVVWLRMASG